MGEVRDFLFRIGVVSSAGSMISNTGIKLLNLKNRLVAIGKKKK
jgi:hypothetical protein